MNIWDKLSKTPAYCSFHDDSLVALNVTEEYIHFRTSSSSFTYYAYEEEFCGVFNNCEENNLFIDFVFLNPEVSEISEFPTSIKFNEHYSIYSVSQTSDNTLSLSFWNDYELDDFFRLDFTYEKCIVKPYGEMPTEHYYEHPELFDKPFCLGEFLEK